MVTIVRLVDPTELHNNNNDWMSDPTELHYVDWISSKSHVTIVWPVDLIEQHNIDWMS